MVVEYLKIQMQGNEVEPLPHYVQKLTQDALKT